MSIFSAISNFWPVTFEDLLPPEHGLDYEQGDMVLFMVPSGREYVGTVKDVCEPELNGDMWLYVEYTMVIDEAAYTVATWLKESRVELLEKNTAA